MICVWRWCKTLGWELSLSHVLLLAETQKHLWFEMSIRLIGRTWHLCVRWNMYVPVQTTASFSVKCCFPSLWWCGFIKAYNNHWSLWTWFLPFGSYNLASPAERCRVHQVMKIIHVVRGDEPSHHDWSGLSLMCVLCWPKARVTLLHSSLGSRECFILHSSLCDAL